MLSQRNRLKPRSWQTVPPGERTLPQRLLILTFALAVAGVEEVEVAGPLESCGHKEEALVDEPVPWMRSCTHKDEGLVNELRGSKQGSKPSAEDVAKLVRSAS